MWMSVQMPRTQRLAPLLLLPALLLTSMQLSTLLFRCRYDHVARTKCCCPKGMKAERTTFRPGAEFLSPAACCNVEKSEVSRIPSEAARSHLEAKLALPPVIVPLTFSAVLPAVILPPPVVSVRAIGPPLLLQKRSLLI